MSGYWKAWDLQQNYVLTSVSSRHHSTDYNNDVKINTTGTGSAYDISCNTAYWRCLSFILAARHVVEKEKDVKRAMEFLQESDLLKIEDILPFFPDFITIDHFKVWQNMCADKSFA